MTLLLDPRSRGVAARAGEEAGSSLLLGAGVDASLPTFRQRCTVVRLATLDNEALGVPRWYTLAEAWCEPGSAAAAAWSRNPVVDVGPGDDPELVLARSTPVVILGAANEGTSWARAVIDSVRASCGSVLVVDLGESRPGRYADIAAPLHDRTTGAALLASLSAPR